MPGIYMFAVGEARSKLMDAVERRQRSRCGFAKGKEALVECRCACSRLPSQSDGSREARHRCYFCHWCSTTETRDHNHNETSEDSEMGMWTAIVLIVAAAMASEAWRHHVRARSAAPRQEELEDLKRKIDTLNADLRRRVETLERIVTVETADLNRQFDILG